LGIEPLQDYPPSERDAGAKERASAPLRDAGSPKQTAATDGGEKQKPPADAGTTTNAATRADSGAKPAESASGMRVQGRVRDALGRPVSNVEVSVGDAKALTDAQGLFSLERITPPYDLQLVLTVTDWMGAPARNTWLFRNLKRPDPTLEIYPGPMTQAARMTLRVSDETSSFAADESLYAAFGGSDGEQETVASQFPFEWIPQWAGPPAIQGTVHGLRVRGDADGLPIEMLAHDARPAALQTGAMSDLQLALTETPSAGVVTGTVTGHGLARANWAVIRWPDGAALSLASDRGPDNFALTVPALPGAVVSVVAREGSIEKPPYAVAFADAALGQSMTLALPRTPILAAPAEATANVDKTTVFKWSAADAKVFVVRVSAMTTSDEAFVVTDQPETTLAALVLPRSTAFRWRVEHHSTATSVDDAAAESGTLSAFWNDRLHGPKRGAGLFAVSELRTFTTAATP
jgi:hypothetical protein